MALADPLSRNGDIVARGQLPTAIPYDDQRRIADAVIGTHNDGGQSNTTASPGTLKTAQDVTYPSSNLVLEDRHIDNVRSLRVVVIGAGLAGITAGILLPVKVPGIKLTILEKNADVVGSRPSGRPSQILRNHIGRYMVREHLSRSPLRYSITRLPVHLLATP